LLPTDDKVTGRHLVGCLYRCSNDARSHKRQHHTYVRQCPRLIYITFSYRVYKGKAIPVQAWTSPEGSGRLRLPDFETVGT